MDREAWQATVCGLTKSWTPLSARAHTHTEVLWAKVHGVAKELDMTK